MFDTLILDDRIHGLPHHTISYPHKKQYQLSNRMHNQGYKVMLP